MTETNAIATMESLKDKVSERIKATFADLIPEDMWKKLIDSQTELFIKNDLPNLVKAELTANYKKQIQEELALPEYQTGNYNNNLHDYEPSNVAKNIIESNIPALIHTLFDGVAQNCIMQIKNSLQRGY